MWQGHCNQCGLCCVKIVAGELYRCENLEAVTELGQPYSSRCGIHEERIDFMPIRLRTKEGKTIVDVCRPDFPRHVAPLEPVPEPCTYYWSPE